MRAMRFVARNFEEILSVILLIALCLATIANVFGRYALNMPVPWAEEFARYAFIWLVFIGAASCSKHKRHIAIYVVVQNLPVRFHAWLRLVTDIATFIFMFILFVYGIRLAMSATYLTATLGLPTYYVYMVVPISALLIVIRMIADFRQNLSAVLGGVRT